MKVGNSTSLRPGMGQGRWKPSLHACFHDVGQSYGLRQHLVLWPCGPAWYPANRAQDFFLPRSCIDSLFYCLGLGTQFSFLHTASFPLCDTALTRKWNIERLEDSASLTHSMRRLEPKSPNFIQNSFHCTGADGQRWPQSTPRGQEGRRAGGPVLMDAQELIAWRGVFPQNGAGRQHAYYPSLFHLVINGAPGGPGMMGWGEMGSEDYYGILTSVFSFRASGTAVRQNGSMQTIIFAALLNIQLLSARDIIDLLN